MQFDKTLKIVICLLMIIPMLNISRASAATNYDHRELSEYEGYGEALYESIVEQTTFISGSYTDNKEYVKQSIDQIKDYANFWKEEHNNFDISCNDSLVGCMRSMVENAGAYTLTVGDWIKKLFNDYSEEYDGSESEADLGSSLSPYFTSSTDRIVINDGFYFTLNNDGKARTYLKLATASSNNSFRVSLLSEHTTLFLQEEVGYANYEETLQFAEQFREQSKNIGVMLGFANRFDLKIYASGGLEVNPSRPPNRVNPITKYINENGPPDVVIPELKPYLICPNGTQIQMNVTGSTFLDSNGTVMQVNKDGTATVNGTNCLLNWEIPPVDYIDGEPAIKDLDGNWLDLLTGELLKCVLSGNCKPSLVDDDAEIQKLDKSLLEYVKNAYEYATSTLKTATDGLKSLANGAKNLTNLFGTFFGWLPTEMVVLMSSGLGIAIGLRLFRK